MAIISIPTSIGGITIPGSVINGPLGALFGNPYGQDSAYYPRDLQSSTKGHIVHFAILETKPLTLEEIKNTSGSALGDLSSIEGTKNLANKIFSFFSDATSNFVTNGVSFQPRRSEPKAHIYLYMPDVVNFQYNPVYEDKDLLSVGSKFLSGIKMPGQNKLRTSATSVKDSALSTISSGVTSGAAPLIGQSMGYVANPQLQLLFQGIGFREYQMVFTFTPYSRQEAEEVKKIIKLFRKFAAPEIITGSAGMFFVPPAAFRTKFLFNGQDNQYVNKVADSVITSIDVNYAPNGWSSLEDGSPVQTTLTLQFKEVELIDKNKIDGGY
jgi:hypothetical protein